MKRTKSTIPVDAQSDEEAALRLIGIVQGPYSTIIRLTRELAAERRRRIRAEILLLFYVVACFALIFSRWLESR